MSDKTKPKKQEAQSVMKIDTDRKKNMQPGNEPAENIRVPATTNTNIRSLLINEVKEWLRSIALAFVLVLLFNQYFFKAYKVEGISMQPLLQDGQRIFVNRYLYSTDPLPLLQWQLPFTEEPERGDVVVFWCPEDPKKSYIKRVIGLPSDVIEIKNGIIYVNDLRVSDSFVPKMYQSDNTMKPMKMPKGYYFCVGDHRNRSYDSRAWGGVPRKYIIGKASFRYWPLSEFGFIKYPNQPKFFVDEQ